jgi:hypothetical protein
MAAVLAKGVEMTNFQFTAEARRRREEKFATDGRR